MRISRSSIPFAVLLLIVLVIAATWLFVAARGDSQTMDEAVHLAAGYSALRTGDFRLNPEHPPLIKLFSALPLLPLHPDLPTSDSSWTQRNEWEFGRLFLYHNRVPAATLIFLGRLGNIFLTLVLISAMGYASWRLFGLGGAFLTLAISVVDPNLLAHGHLVTTDLGVALFFFLSIAVFARALQTGRRRDYILFLALFSAAQLSKFSAVIFFPIIIILRIIWDWQHGVTRFNMIKHALKLFGHTVLVTLLGAFLLYGFSFQRISADPRIEQLYQDRLRIVSNNTVSQQAPLTQLLINITNPSSETGQAIRRIVDHARVPLYPFFRGLAAVYSHNYGGHLSYLLGHHSQRGWWYYFPLAFAVKTPGGTLALVGLVVIAAITWFARKSLTDPALRWKNALPFTAIWLFVPPVYYFLTSLTSHINLGIRHLLPIYPFLFVSLGWLATLRLSSATKIFRWILGSLAGLAIIESMLFAPFFLAFFNSLSGGPRFGPKYLVDSNIDWGQDLDRLGSALKRRQVNEVALAYFGSAEVEGVLPRIAHLPTSSEPELIKSFHGVAAISVTALLSYDHAYSWLWPKTPTETIGYSIFLYDFRKY